MQKSDEKIRKAEEIYCRRNGIKYRGEKVKNKTHNLNLGIVLFLVLAIYLYENNTTIINGNMKRQIRNFLNTPIRFESILDFVKDKKKENEKQETVEKNEVAPLDETESMIEPVNEEIVNIDGQQNIFIWPYKGEITSYFGERISEDTRVNSNHTGIDIAGNER